MARQGTRHSKDTKEKIAKTVQATKAMLRRQKLAERAAAAAEAATADLRSSLQQMQHLSSESNSDDDDDDDTMPLVITDLIELEKTVIEMNSLRSQLTAWMTAYENKYGTKPDLTETSESHPQVYGRFVRFVALREIVRQSTLAS